MYKRHIVNLLHHWNHYLNFNQLILTLVHSPFSFIIFLPFQQAYSVPQLHVPFKRSRVPRCHATATARSVTSWRRCSWRSGSSSASAARRSTAACSARSATRISQDAGEWQRDAFFGRGAWADSTEDWWSFWNIFWNEWKVRSLGTYCEWSYVKLKSWWGLRTDGVVRSRNQRNWSARIFQVYV